MAAAPTEGPTLFACLDCQTLHAGTPKGESPPFDEYQAPEECGGCGGTDFAALDEYPEAF